MAEIKVNSDLLKCENDFFTKESKTKSLLITKNAKKNTISAQLSEKPLKTEKISSSVLSRAKQFLDITKTDDTIAEKCDLVDQNKCLTKESDGNHSKQMIEMNLMLFENKKQSNSESSDEESHSTESSDSSAEDSDEDTTDSEQHSDEDTNHGKQNK